MNRHNRDAAHIAHLKQRVPSRCSPIISKLTMSDLTSNQVFFEALHGVALKGFQNSLEISLYPVRLFYLSRCALDLVEASSPRLAIAD